MGVDGSPAQSPALRGRDNLAARADTPVSYRFEAHFGGSEKRDGTGCVREKTAQALGDQTEDFFARGAGLKQASEFADLGNLGGLAAGVLEEVSDLFVRGRELSLRGFALGNFLLLVVLGESESDSEGEERSSDRDVGEKSSVSLFPAIHQDGDADHHQDEDEICAEETDEVLRFVSGDGFRVRHPRDGDKSRSGLIQVPGQVEPGGSSRVVMEIDPVTDEGCHCADQQEQSEAAQQVLRTARGGELQAHQNCDEKNNALGVTDADIMEEGLGGEHPARRKKEECGIDKSNDDRDLKEIEKNFGLDIGAPSGIREEEHHEDGRAIKAIEQTPGGI